MKPDKRADARDERAGVRRTFTGDGAMAVQTPGLPPDPVVVSTGDAARARRLLAAWAHHTTLRSIMSRDVCCVTADLSVESLATLLLERGISGAPVVDREGHAIGVVSKTDLVRARRETGDEAEHELPEAERRRNGLDAGYHLEPLASATVGDIMMPAAFTLDEHSSVLDAARLMVGEGIHRVPVVGPDGTVVGIVSSLDALGWLALSEDSDR